jgi:hypothetical protein
MLFRELPNPKYKVRTGFEVNPFFQSLGPRLELPVRTIAQSVRRPGIEPGISRDRG